MLPQGFGSLIEAEFWECLPVLKATDHFFAPSGV
jgi:hypothetical protein